ncbi:non-heme iron oxygenase ferredoxin subunit [Brachybacterium sp.]|uniref:non-heme iron oxygenase ferredoxin subunit n=1 Tax=Brachybacterium sp. TaxID=1891286 RepID=UPI002ED25D2E
MSDAFVPVAALADLAPGEVLDVAIGDLEIAVVRDEDGGVHALEDICSHDEIALSDGDVEGCTIECWKHGSQFDLVTGRPLQLPAVLPVRVFPVRIDEDSGEILVDPTAAPAT